MKYGVEKESTAIDNLGSTVTLIKKIRGSEVTSIQKQYKVRIKVFNQEDERTEYRQFSDFISKKKGEGKLVVKDDDQTTRPNFLVEHPKHDVDGSYFIIKSWTEAL